MVPALCIYLLGSIAQPIMSAMSSISYIGAQQSRPVLRGIIGKHESVPGHGRAIRRVCHMTPNNAKEGERKKSSLNDRLARRFVSSRII